jgi:ABC-type nitrate/sulfonate/bicarbonate transport system ATPase subunit
LSLLRELRFDAPGAGPRRLRVEEASGKLREQYLSRASYSADPETWHVPWLLIGKPGLGRRSLLEFVARLADAELLVFDLAAAPQANAVHFAALERLRAEAEEGPAPRRRLCYVANLDAYSPGMSGSEAQNCLWPLRKLLRALERLGPHPAGGYPLGLAASISGDVRLRVPAQQTRLMIREIEDVIGGMTGFKLSHLGLDEHGWPLDHPRVVRMPSLAERGPAFLAEAAEARLGLLSDGKPARLQEDVADLLLARTDWSGLGNLAGLVSLLDEAHARFAAARASHQEEITRAHLPEEAQQRLRRTVFRGTGLRLELRGPGERPLPVIAEAELDVQEGELLVILGPSGCGKTSLLRLLAGLIRPTAGTLLFRGEPILGPSAATGFVFQDYSLFPWLTVRGNVEFGLRGLDAGQRAAHVTRLLEAAGLEAFERSYPHQLSGGMRQRVATIRAIAPGPAALLMDEPFGALDVVRRWEMQDFLLRTLRRTNTTTVFVTHDVEEAVYLAGRIRIASPRPMRLLHEFRVPFSHQARSPALRRDPAYSGFVGRVREALMQAAQRESPPRPGPPPGADA